MGERAREGAPAAHPCLGVYGDPEDAGRPTGRSLCHGRLCGCPTGTLLSFPGSALALTWSLAASLRPSLRLHVSDTCVCAPRPRSADVSRAVELLERLQRSGELPPQKLQALQRVLQSRFCSAIREVRATRRRAQSGGRDPLPGRPEPGDYASQQLPGRPSLGCPRFNSGVLWEL